MRNIKLTIEYEGTKFCGWQYQPRGRTVQGVIEDAIHKLTQKKVRIIGSGRTDSGVHALAQVANFRIESDHSIEVFRKGLNSWLPYDVRIVAAEEVDLGFHSIRDAQWRRYRYQVMQRFSPLLRRTTLHISEPLNVNDMHTAVQALKGEHDCSSFCAAGSQVSHHIVHVKDVFWKTDGDLIIFEICANRFLYSMVRILVGTSLDIGRGKLPVEMMGEILTAQDRSKASATAQAKGLFLVKVDYKRN